MGGARNIKEEIVPYQEESSDVLCHDKLVSDGIPEVIAKAGQKAIWRQGKDVKALFHCLQNKLRVDWLFSIYRSVEGNTYHVQKYLEKEMVRWNGSVLSLLPFVLDEWLLNDLSDEELHFLFELVERRYEESATIFCTQYKVEDWHARLGGGVLADSIMDRIVHKSFRAYSGNLNMREFYAKRA